MKQSPHAAAILSNNVKIIKLLIEHDADIHEVHFRDGKKHYVCNAMNSIVLLNKRKTKK